MKEKLLLLRDLLEPQKTKYTNLQNIQNIQKTSVSKNVYIDKLFDMVNKYSNKYYSRIKMKLVDVNSSTYINFGKFEVSDQVRISIYKNNLAKLV